MMILVSGKFLGNFFGEMGGLTNFFLACSAENFEKVTVKGGEIGDFFE